VRILPLILAAILLPCAAHAQQREPATEVHCEADHSKSGQDYAELERQCLAQLDGLASREGDSLRLTLGDGNIQTWTNQREACEQHDAAKCLVYQLTTYCPLQRLFVIERSAYESFDVLVISRKSGTTTKLDAHPHVAPGGKRLVATAAIEAWKVENEIALYSIQEGGLRSEWKYKAKDYEMWEFVAWDGSERIRLKVTLRAVDRHGVGSLVTQPAELRRSIFGWQLKKNTKP
jgi:hypothetical protein